MCSFLSFLKGRAIQLVRINFEFMKKMKRHLFLKGTNDFYANGSTTNDTIFKNKFACPLV